MSDIQVGEVRKDIKIIQNLIDRDKKLFEANGVHAVIQNKEISAIENLIARNKELESALNISVSKDEIKERIEQLDKRLDYIDKELTKAYIEREKLGIESEIDVYEQYIYNMEQEQSIRHTQKYAYKELLNKGE